MPPNIRVIFFPWLDSPSGSRPPQCRGFTITHRHTTVGMTALDEWSTHRRDLYLKTHNTHKRHPYPRQNSNPKSQQSAPADPRLILRDRWDRLTLVKNALWLLIFLRPAICQYLVLNGVTAVVRYLAVFVSLPCCYPPKSDKTLKICRSFENV
jgi:hypothetical protein